MQDYKHLGISVAYRAFKSAQEPPFLVYYENGPELLTMFNGKAIVQPLNGSVPKSSAMGGGGDT